MTNLLPVDALDPLGISNGVPYLVSATARCVTRISLPMDAGVLANEPPQGWSE